MIRTGTKRSVCVAARWNGGLNTKTKGRPNRYGPRQ